MSNGWDKLQKRLESLLEYVKTTDLEGIDWEKDGEEVSFRRMPGTDLPHHALTVHPHAHPKPPPPPPAPKVIRSPMVGTFFRSQRPDGPPLVMEGTEVGPDSVVGMVESMRVRRDVHARASGRVLKILVEDNHPVEYNQPLFELE